MDPKVTMAKIAKEIDDLNNPSRLDLQARYENARISVDLGYRHAATLGQGGGANSEDYIEFARKLSKAIEKDLNDALKVLDAKPKPPEHP